MLDFLDLNQFAIDECTVVHSSSTVNQFCSRGIFWFLWGMVKATVYLKAINDYGTTSNWH